MGVCIDNKKVDVIIESRCFQRLFFGIAFPAA